MGVLFIAAGASSKNREKTLEKSHAVAELSPFLSPEDAEHLRSFFPDGQGVYIWGANPQNFNTLSKVEKGEYAVDVKNKKVIQIFHYCFFVKTANTRLQEFLGWDSEKPKTERRSYKYVYFLSSPLPTSHHKKEYFQTAFNLESNQNWLVGQRYFNDSDVAAALQLTSTASVQALLGIDLTRSTGIHAITLPTTAKPTTIIRRKADASISEPDVELPPSLQDLVSKVNALKDDEGHLERDHEDLVASLFEILGYERVHDIKFRRGNIDIRIEKDGNPLITIEVKADWGLSAKNRRTLSQAYNYANETGTPFVIITNGDIFCIYDRRQGLSYEDNLVADFSLTCMNQKAIDTLNLLKKENIT